MLHEAVHSLATQSLTWFMGDVRGTTALEPQLETVDPDDEDVNIGQEFMDSDDEHDG
jgi:hypothetical protein